MVIGYYFVDFILLANILVSKYFFLFTNISSYDIDDVSHFFEKANANTNDNTFRRR